jgi:hypothetical protein
MITQYAAILEELAGQGMGGDLGCDILTLCKFLDNLFSTK